MNAHLRDALHDLADTQAFRPDPATWDRGRRARGRDRAVLVAAVLVLIASLGGIGTLAMERQPVGPAGAADVPGGAIPSRIAKTPPDRDPAVEKDLRVGRASVAFLSPGRSSPIPLATVIGATDGRYRLLSLPGLDHDRKVLALSPDGRRLAWRSVDGELHVVDLTSGEVTDLPGSGGARPYSNELNWWADSTHLTWAGVPGGAGVIDVTTGEEVAAGPRDLFMWGPVSPDGDLVALSRSRSKAAWFARKDPERELRRALPADLYPKGAAVTPLGWADDHLVLAHVSSPSGSYVEGDHLVLLTSPDRPESGWTYRIVMRDAPDAMNLSIAADLVPDLDGTSFQQLTHDFGEADWPPSAERRVVTWLLGLLAAAAAAYVLWRARRRPLAFRRLQ